MQRGFAACGTDSPEDGAAADVAVEAPEQQPATPAGGGIAFAESGARYGVPFDDEALQALGLKNIAPRLAPWPLLRIWPAGPELSRQAAMTMHDTTTGSAAPITEQGR